jgi:signal transduction histidine kinase
MRTDREHGLRAILVLFAALGTAVVIFVPQLRLGVGSAAGGAIVLMLLGMAWLFMAILTAQRFGRTASRLDLAIGIALGIFAVVSIAYALDCAALISANASSATLLPYGVLAAIVLAGGALARDRAMMLRPRTAMVLLWCLAALIPVFIAQHVGLIPGTDVDPGPEPTAIIVLRCLFTALLALAAWALVTRHAREDDPLIRWLAVALAFGALVQLHRISIAPPAQPELSWANVLQIGEAAALLVGCVAEIRSYQRRLTESAVADERRRIARDLHDGVAQDVAFIASQSKRMNEQARDESLALISSAAERALADSRCIVGALTRASSQPLSASIALQAQEFARRWSLEVDVATKEDVAVSPEKQEAVLRIVGEALSNAARHAEATHVQIEVAAGEGPLRVAVTDDGRGFDPESPHLGTLGFGLRSMRERAQLVGGDVELLSAPGHGTRVEIAIP